MSRTSPEDGLPHEADQPEAESGTPSVTPGREPETADTERLRGSIVSFNRNRGFGFVAVPDGRSFFIHYTELADPDVTFLVQDQEVEFTPVSDPRGNRAVQVRLVSPRIAAQTFRTRRRRRSDASETE
jgi:cold shock CspA family protein